MFDDNGIGGILQSDSDPDQTAGKDKFKVMRQDSDEAYPTPPKTNQKSSALQSPSSVYESKWARIDFQKSSRITPDSKYDTLGSELQLSAPEFVPSSQPTPRLLVAPLAPLRNVRGQEMKSSKDRIHVLQVTVKAMQARYETLWKEHIQLLAEHAPPQSP